MSAKELSVVKSKQNAVELATHYTQSHYSERAVDVCQLSEETIRIVADFPVDSMPRNATPFGTVVLAEFQDQHVVCTIGAIIHSETRCSGVRSSAMRIHS